MATITKDEAEKVINLIVNDEYVVGKQNNAVPDADYEDYLDMFDCERTEKNYDWMSDVYFPEFVSQALTQMAVEASLLFKTHDFVDVYIGSEEELHIKAAKAARDLLNKTLNRRKLFFYHKYMRAIAMKNLGGAAYFRAWWEQKTVRQQTGQTRTVIRNLGVDESGNPIRIFDEEKTKEEVVIKDYFNFDVIDPRDIFFDNSYVYSMQEKRWIIIRFNKTIDELEEDAELMEYFNLDKLRDLQTSPLHQTSVKGDKTTHHGLDNKQESKASPLKEWEILQRFGKYRVVVKDRDPDGNPIEVTHGIDKTGKPKRGSSLEEMVITIATNGQQSVLIGFSPQRNIDADGNQYRPIARGLCYIHPSKDDGMGDGKCLKELQVGINDTINMENDRTKLATIPVMQGNEHDITDNESLIWEPGAFWSTESGNVLSEVRVSSDVGAALNQVGLYRSMMQQASGVSAETQAVLNQASTSATATANQARRSDSRSLFRTLTMENTGLTELYWFILQMTARHMKQATAEKYIGQEGVQYFNPTLDFTYKPVSANIDSDASKQTKITNWLQIIGYIINDPERRDAVDYILKEIAELMGKEYETFGDSFLAQKGAPPNAGQIPGGAQTEQPGALRDQASNQFGGTQSPLERQVRSLISA